MLRLFSLLFLFIVSLHALSNTEIIKRAEGFMKSNSKNDYFRAYNDYKNLYLRAVMDGDDKLKYISLNGIVSSGNKLRIDVRKYANELKEINGKKSKKAPEVTKKQVKKKQVKEKKNKKIKVKSSHKLQSVRFIGDELVLDFDKSLSQKQVNYFTLYDPKINVYKYIFDIHASMLTSSKAIRKKGIKRIQLAQYKPNTLRLVIQNDSKINLRFSRKGDLLVIRLKQASRVTKTKKASKTQAPFRLDRKKTIVIDPGHGGKDPGAVGYKKYREKDVVFAISKELKRILKSRGYTVYMTRDRDKFIKLSSRTKYANKKKADIFVSIHANAVSKRKSKAYGIECYFLSKSRTSRAKKVAEKENSADLSDMNFYGKQSFLNTLSSHNIVASNKLAIDLQRGMLGSLKKHYKKIKDGGVREGPFWVLVGAQMPAVLVEAGFITNPTEAMRLRTKKYQKRLAKGLANGIERYFANTGK